MPKYCCEAHHPRYYLGPGKVFTNEAPIETERERERERERELIYSYSYVTVVWTLLECAKFWSSSVIIP